MDSTEVQNTEQVSEEEQVSPPTETIVEPSPEEKIATLIERKVAEELAKVTESSRREIQSAKDKATAEVEAAHRRAKFAEDTITKTRAHMQDVDPDVAKEMELSELRAREQGRLTMEQEEAARRQQEEFRGQFFSGLTQFVTGLGVDPKDQRIDWAENSKDYLEAQRRVLDSVMKIQKANTQTLQDGFNKRLKDLEAKFGQVNEEVNSVSTTTSQGVVAGSDAEFVKKFGSGELEMTKANVERYNKITKSY